MPEQYEEGDIIEPEDFRNPTEQAFSHESLIMMAMKKCIDAGSKELREGWWDEKTDKFGNIHRSYHEDTRKVFIESVKSLIMVIICDYDEEATNKIQELKDILKDRKLYWQQQEWNWWSSLSPMIQQQLAKEGRQVVKGMFNKKLEFDNFYFEEETEIYREIFEEVSKLTKRRDFFGAVGYMA